MSMRINIHQTNAVLGIDIQPAQLNVIRSRELKMNIEQESARMQIEWNRPKVRYDGGSVVGAPIAVSQGTGNNSRVVRADFSDHSKLNAMKSVNNQKAGAAQSAINASRYMMEEQHKKTENTESKKTGKIKIDPGFYTFKYHGGRIKVNVEEVPEQVEFINYSIDIYLEQEPSIEITVDEYLDRLVAEQKEPSGQFFSEAL